MSITPANPKIGYHTLALESSAVQSSSGDNTSYPYQNAFDWNPVTFWQPAATGTQFLKVAFTTPKGANYFAIYSQTYYLTGATIKLRWSNDDVTYNDAMPAFVPASAAPIYLSFNQINALYWKVEVSNANGSLLGVVAFGIELQTERGCFVGFMPPTLARDTEMSNNVSQTGAFIGRSIIRKHIRGDLKLDILTQAWVRNYWLPFVKHSELRPWFLCWNQAAYANEVAYCYSQGTIPPCSNTKAGQGFMSAGITYAGNIE